MDDCIEEELLGYLIQQKTENRKQKYPGLGTS